MTMTSRLLASVALASAVFIAVPAQSQPLQGPYAYEAPHGAPMSFADLIEQVSPAVVSIEAQGVAPDAEEPDLSELPPQFREFFERFGQGQGQAPQRPRRSSGSGFFISADGYVVTNNHVIDGTEEISVSLSDGRTLSAEVVGTDQATDLALLRVTEDNDGEFAFVELARDLDVRVGDWVVAVGNPFGLGGTATAGIISASGREIGPAQAYTDFLQIDAPINRGNSGGPTFDLNGNVVGVNSAIISPTGGNVGIGFAIPSDLAAQVIDQLIENGQVRRGYLGVAPVDLTSDLREAFGISEDTEGVLINSVIDGTPADEAGLENGDIVLQVQGNSVEDARDLTRQVGALAPGETVRFRILRDGDERNVRVTLTERPGQDELAGQGDGSDQGEANTLFGMSLEVPDEEARERLGVESGLLITSVTPQSEAASKGLRPGDVILQASNNDVSGINDLQAAIDRARERGRSAISIYVRGQSGQSRYVALRLEDEDEN